MPTRPQVNSCRFPATAMCYSSVFKQNEHRRSAAPPVTLAPDLALALNWTAELAAILAAVGTATPAKPLPKT